MNARVALKLRRHGRGLTAVAIALVTTAAQAADDLRDPMQPPPAARATPSNAAPGAVERAASGALDTAAGLWRPRYLIVSNGKRYLVHEARRYAVGDAFGSARIERIDDQAVWLREGAQLTRMPMFGAVEKRIVKATDTPTGTAPEAGAAKRLAPRAPSRPAQPLAPNRPTTPGLAPAAPQIVAAPSHTPGPAAPTERKERQP